jgi:hypothetical protein
MSENTAARQWAGRPIFKKEFRLPVAAREEAEQREHQDHDKKNP